MVDIRKKLEQFPSDASDGSSHGGCGSCGTGEAGARCGNGLEKIYPTTAVRFGYMRYIGEFTHAPDMRFTCGARVVIQTKRGIELGEQVSLTCTGCDKSVTRDQMKAWVKSCGEDAFIFEAGRILREATASDLAEYAHIQQDCRNKRNFAQQVADRHNVQMKMIDCECPFGGERIILFFTAEQRVDFRAVVKDLAKEYRTRIEMRQVGARDEARLLADYETCGREVCCKVFLKTLRPITMRMAKLQKATLDPTQVSGRCGRLKCCLRYEHTGYEELDKMLPRNGTHVRTPHGDGVIVNRQVLTQLVQIRTEDDRLVTVVAEDIFGPDDKMPERAAPATAPPAAPPGAPRRDAAPRGRRRPAKSGPPAGGSNRDNNATARPAQPGATGRDRAPGPDDAAKKEGASEGQESAQQRERRRGGRRRRRRRGGGGGDRPQGPGNA